MRQAGQRLAGRAHLLQRFGQVGAKGDERQVRSLAQVGRPRSDGAAGCFTRPGWLRSTRSRRGGGGDAGALLDRKSVV